MARSTIEGSSSRSENHVHKVVGDRARLGFVSLSENMIALRDDVSASISAAREHRLV